MCKILTSNFDSFWIQTVSRKKNFTPHFIHLFTLLVIACCDGVFSWLHHELQSTTKYRSWSIVKFNPVMLSECKASAQQSTNFNQDFWSWCLNTITASIHFTINYSLVCVNIVFAFYRILPFKCIAINVNTQSIFSPCISSAQLFVDLCAGVCVCRIVNISMENEFNSIFSAIIITKTNKQTDKHTLCVRCVHCCDAEFWIYQSKHMFDNLIVESFKIIRICMEIWWNISNVIAGWTTVIVPNVHLYHMKNLWPLSTTCSTYW